ncbi:MAG: hypothetical protein AB7F66_17740 [Bacteriovoracia bacterium]
MSNSGFSFMGTITAIVLLGVCCGLGGCGEESLKYSDNWLPQSVGGPVEIRPLPESNRLKSDYEQWIHDTGGPKVRLYEQTISHPGEQVGFVSEVRRDETPLGRVAVTHASFIYSNEVKGEYRFEWMMNGRQNPQLLRIEDRPKRMLLRLTHTKDVVLARLQIVAIEGVGSHGTLVATQPEAGP